VELYPGVYQIQSLYGERNLFQYLFVGDSIVLLDTGIASTPQDTIFPYLDRLKIKPQRINLAITTHADLDHQGGNDALKRASPGTWLACGEADRALVEDPRALYDLRYNHLISEHDVGIHPEPSPDAGSLRRMDLSFTGGEVIRLGEDWHLEVLHVPGHSQGHLALFDAKNKTVFAGDAVHGRGCPKAAGGMALPVTYYDVDLYLSTLRLFEGLAIEVFFSGHWPVMRKEKIRDFIGESRRTVELVDRVILSSLAENPAGLTLKELIDAVANAVGDWPKDTWRFAMFPIKGHMDRLEQLGKVRPRRDSLPIKWQLS
jgi:glyoxylase-like metal-dependent hydrolase (beta-lactamase superfamily II)